MPEASETQLVSTLIHKTEQNQVDWQATAVPSQLTASFAGKYTIVLSGGGLLGNLGATLKVKNADGDELVSLNNLEEPRLQPLYELARHYVRAQVDDQLADLINELDKPPHAETHEERARRIDKIMRERDKK